MGIIWRMWRMVHKLHSLQQVYIDTRREAITDIDKRNMAVFSKKEWFVPKDNLYIQKPTRGVIMGSTENFRNQKREYDKTQETIDVCIKKGFIQELPTDKRMIALTEDGLEFMDFSFFLKYLFTELKVVGTVIATILSSFIAGITGIGVHEIWSAIIGIIDWFRKIRP